MTGNSGEARNIFDTELTATARDSVAFAGPAPIAVPIGTRMHVGFAAVEWQVLIGRLNRSVG